MALVTDLILAVVVTLTLGVCAILADSSLGRAFMPMIAISIFAGILVLVRRRGPRVIPIAAIYAVVMFGVLVYLAFMVAWRRGDVEF